MRAGRVYSILKNWPERRVKAVCVTDGERVGFLGDLGVQAVGVPISKLALYSACAGIPPTVCLPVCIDAGGPPQPPLYLCFYPPSPVSADPRWAPHYGCMRTVPASVPSPRPALCICLHSAAGANRTAVLCWML